MADELDFIEASPSSKLDEYDIGRDVAEGTFGIVKSAFVAFSSNDAINHVVRNDLISFLLAEGYHKPTNQNVAMKYLSKSAIVASKLKLQVQREIDFMRTLRHPNIIELCASFFHFLASSVDYTADTKSFQHLMTL